MKRILMVGPVPPPYGGIASVLEDIVRSELASEYDFEVFPRSATFPPEAHGPLGRNLFRFKRFLTFFQKLRTGRYYLVHIQSPDPAFLGSCIFTLLARLAGVKVVLHMHGTDWGDFFPYAPPWRKLLVRLGLPLPSRIVVLYSLWEDNIKKICPSANVRTIRNLVHIHDLPDARAVGEARARIGLKPDDFVLLFVGALGWRKGCFQILKALSQVIEQDAGMKALFVGGEDRPGDMKRFCDMIGREKLAPWVITMGEVPREDVSLYFGMGDVYLLPSFIEGLPISILEAMRAAVPVVTTPVGAIPEMIDHGVSGLLINPGAPEEIAEAILRLRHDGDFRRRIGAAGRRTFDDKFEFSQGIDELRTLYRTM